MEKRINKQKQSSGGKGYQYNRCSKRIREEDEDEDDFSFSSQFSEEDEEMEEEDEDEDEDDQQDVEEDQESQDDNVDEESQEEENGNDSLCSYSVNEAMKIVEKGSTEDEQKSVVSVIIGQMGITPGHVKLYKHLINQFGEIVSPNLSKYKVKPTCTAVNGLLDAVADMIHVTPVTISREQVLDWEEMVSFYHGMGLKVGWLKERVKRYSNWLVARSNFDVNQFKGKIAAKRETLEAKRKEVSILERELQELRVELEAEQQAQTRFNFSFFDE